MEADTIETSKLLKLQAVVDDLSSFIGTFHELWSVKQSNDAYLQLENCVDICSKYYPNSFDLKFFKAALPSKRQEFKDGAMRCLALAKQHPTSYWIYSSGIPAATAAGDYETAHALLDLATPYYKAWPPSLLFDMLSTICQTGEHPLGYSVWSFLLAEHSSHIPPHIADRTSCFFYNTYLSGVRLISLGENCFPWARLAAWGLRRRTWAPSEQMPLNLGFQTGAAGCLPMLKSRFAELTDQPELSLLPNGDGCLFPFHRRYRYVFNHETGDYWVANNYERLRNRYNERIRNFFEFGCSGPRVYVYYLHRVATITGIEEALSDLAEDQNYRLVIVDVREIEEDWSPSDPRTTYLRTSLPWPGYIWYHADDFNSEGGVAFERTIHDTVRGVMEAMAGSAPAK